MDKLDVIIWMIGGGFVLMSLMWNNLTSRIDKLDEKVTDIDRRLCRIEGSMAAKECCMLKDERQLRKVE